MAAEEVNGIFRVDISTKNPLHHFTVMHVYACSSVDLEMETYNPQLPSATGCNTPGFISKKIYGQGKIRDASFHAKVKARSIVLNENVVDPRTPVVYIQVELRLTDEDGLLMAPSLNSVAGDPFTLTTRYTHVKRAGASPSANLENPSAGGQEGSGEVPWYYFTIGGIGVAAVFAGIGVTMSNWSSNRAKRRLRGIAHGYDMETGAEVGSLSDFIKKRSSSYAKWALKEGWWKTDN